jgi:hypothetical protein
MGYRLRRSTRTANAPSHAPARQENITDRNPDKNARSRMDEGFRDVECSKKYIALRWDVIVMFAANGVSPKKIRSPFFTFVGLPAHLYVGNHKLTSTPVAHSSPSYRVCELF